MTSLESLLNMNNISWRDTFCHEKKFYNINICFVVPIKSYDSLNKKFLFEQIFLYFEDTKLDL